MSEKREPDLVYIDDDPSKKLSYLEVWLFVTRVLDTSMTTKQMFDILTSLEEEPRDYTTFVFSGDHRKKVEMAKEIVDKYLLRKEPS